MNLPTMDIPGMPGSQMGMINLGDVFGKGFGKQKKIKKMMVMLTLKNNKPGSPLLLHDEPICCDGKIVGRTTSGNYSFNYEKNMSFGYLNLVSPIE